MVAAKKRRILFVADPLETLNPQTDTTLAFLQAFEQRGDEARLCVPKDIVWSGHGLKLRLSRGRFVPLDTFDLCFIRKNPPFDEEYKDLCWRLALQPRPFCINPPEVLLTFHEKMPQWRFFHEGLLGVQNVIPTCLATADDVVEDFLSSQPEDTFAGGYLLKPWLGHAGLGIETFDTKDQLWRRLKSHWQENESRALPETFMLQPLLSEIHAVGDRRVLVAGGEIIGHFVRRPRPGRVESNSARGGRMNLEPMDPEVTALCQNLAQTLLTRGIFFAGLDVIGQRIGEINITSPTGLLYLQRLTNEPSVGPALEAILRAVAPFIRTQQHES